MKHAALKRALDKGDKEAVHAAIAKMSYHAKDLLVSCACGASEGDECIGTKAKVVHFGRRLKRLLAGIK